MKAVEEAVEEAVTDNVPDAAATADAVTEREMGGDAVLAALRVQLAEQKEAADKAAVVERGKGRREGLAFALSIVQDAVRLLTRNRRWNLTPDALEETLSAALKQNGWHCAPPSDFTELELHAVDTIAKFCKLMQQPAVGTAMVMQRSNMHA